jgi:flagellar basal-body rod protein FlgF
MIENLAYVVLSRQTSLQREIDVVANNLANMNTTAFKRERTLFETYLMPTKGDDRPLNMVLDYGITRDFTSGAVTTTGNRLDLAISGDGFFVLEGKDGLLYTRNGNFQLNEKGEIVSKTGRRVLTTTGNPIVVSPQAERVDIAKDGTVTSDLGSLGRIDLVKFDDPQALKAVGDAAFETNQQPTPMEKPKIIQGALETSNVEGILEMTSLIQSSRSYASVANILSKDDDMRQRVMGTIGRMI